MPRLAPSRAARGRRGRAAALAAALVLAAAPSLAPIPAVAQAEDAAPAVERVITGQMQAFLDDDFAAAFDYASPMIRDIFRDPQNFGRMVKQGYPMVWRPGDVDFGALEAEGLGLNQTVVIRDQAGKTWIADYSMIRVDGDWRIDGVRIREAPGVGA